MPERMRDIWAHYNRRRYCNVLCLISFFCSFPLILTNFGGCGRFCVCLHRNMKTPSCFSKLICPHVSQYDLSQHKVKEGKPICLSDMLPFELTFTNHFMKFWFKDNLLWQKSMMGIWMALSGPLLKINSEGLCQLTWQGHLAHQAIVSLSLETALIAHMHTL